MARGHSCLPPGPASLRAHPAPTPLQSQGLSWVRLPHGPVAVHTGARDRDFLSSLSPSLRPAGSLSDPSHPGTLVPLEGPLHVPWSLPTKHECPPFRLRLLEAGVALPRRPLCTLDPRGACAPWAGGQDRASCPQGGSSSTGPCDGQTASSARWGSGGLAATETGLWQFTKGI